MKIECLKLDVQEEILSKIFNSEYKEIMRLSMQGYSYTQIADATGYSDRQISRIVPRCWSEVCISLAKEKLEHKKCKICGAKVYK